MTTSINDQTLRSMFVDVQQELDGEAITANIIARTRKLNYTIIAGGVLIMALVLTGLWLAFGIPLLAFAVLMSEFFTTALIDLGSGWLGLIFLPVNNIASLLILLARALHLLWKKLLV